MSAKFKDTLRSIRKSLNRYLSIFMIVAIGVGFFGGVKASGPDMRKSADVYAGQQNLMHFRLLSTWGFDDRDLKRLEIVTGAQIRPSYFLDVISKQGGTDKVARIYAYERLAKINMLDLASGKWPRTEKECLAESGSGLRVGDTVKLDTEDLKENELTVSGIIRTSMYLSDFEKGNTNLGNGSIAQVLYVPASDFLSEVHTEVYLVFDDLLQAEAFTEEYELLEQEHKEDLEVIGQDLAQQRKQRVMADGMEQLEEAQETIDEANAQIGDGFQQLLEIRTQYKEGKLEFDQGQQTLNDSEAAITSGESEISAKEWELSQYQQQLAGAKTQYNQGLSEYQTAKSEADAQLLEAETKLETARVQLENGRTQLDTAKSQLDGAYLIYNGIVEQYNSSVAEADTYLTSLLESGTASEEAIQRARTALSLVQQFADARIAEAKTTLDGYLEAYNTQESLYAENKTAYDEALAEYTAQKTAAEAKLASAKAELDRAYAQISSSESKIQSGQNQLAAAKNELAAGKLELSGGKMKLEESRLTLENAASEIQKQSNLLKEKVREVNAAQKELDQSKAELEKLEAPSWYIFTRKDNPGYDEYGQNADRMNNIAKVFPVFFILVAALVVLTTMTRMIEEERTQIGTMKALGYSDFSILSKYMIYTLSACGMGAVAGLIFGYLFFPWVIMTAYGIMYRIPMKTMPIYMDEALIIILIAMAVCAITVFLCFHKYMRSLPAKMMRPKAPQKGKKVLLEYLPFIWKHLSFSRKVMIRNLLRYKKRMIMTVVGIMGCTALSLTGFGLSDAINDIIANQFDRVWQYNGMAFMDEASEQTESAVLEILRQYDENAQCTMAMQKSFTFEHGTNHMSGMLSVCEDPGILGNMVHLVNRITGEEYHLNEDEVLVTEKMADRLQASQGDILQIRIDEMNVKDVKVGGIVENYAQHFVYMHPKTYGELFDEPDSYNTLLIKADWTADQENAAAKEILSRKHVVAYQKLSSSRESYSRMIKALDLVVLVLIISAALLAFVVVYNLTNININERVREIATLEVLGFRDREVSQYVFHESFIMTLMGVAAGLFLGKYLCSFVVLTAEVDLVMFGREIHRNSYLYAATLTILFSEIVNLIMRGPLRKISMVESLKSVE